MSTHAIDALIADLADFRGRLVEAKDTDLRVWYADIRLPLRAIEALVALREENERLSNRLRDAPLGGSGSHWADCWRSHIDCARARVESLTGENERLRGQLERARSLVRPLAMDDPEGT